jgi:hypothetical protein
MGSSISNRTLHSNWFQFSSWWHNDTEVVSFYLHLHAADMAL